MASFNFDMSGLMTTAASIFNSFAPIFLAIAGISVGLGLLIKVVSELRHAF
jgi:crotonobetainyl-CoA:carnitine CoA-transferase CaiB-like acyl-CoA transferase